MKKIGIATFHYADNYGAVLQAYALRRTINCIEGCQAELINYVPSGYMIHPYEASVTGISNMKKKRVLYEKFLQEYCNINSPMINKITGKDFDYCCTGSDQVWNMSFAENITKEYLFPNVDKNVKCFSYPASVGGKIAQDDKEYFKECLSSFIGLSVREKSVVDSLQEIGVNNAEVSLDPTLLLNIEDYEELIVAPENAPNNFLFFFSYPIGDEVRKYAPFINMLARKYELKIKHSIVNAPRGLFAPDIGAMIYEGIGEFLWYMMNASIVVTTSYHGAIFGNLFHKPTYIICRDRGKERFIQLMRIFENDSCFVDDKWILQDWNTEDCMISEEKLKIWRNKSIDYLRRVINV